MIDEKHNEIISVYAEIISKINNRPTYADFLDYSITRDHIRSRFGGIEKLHAYILEHYPDFLKNHFIPVESISPAEQFRLVT